MSAIINTKGGKFRMRILIFEDNKNDINHLKRCCKCFFEKRNISYEIDVCENIDFLFKQINQYDLLFLDMKMDTINGIEVGIKVRNLNENCRIIITSNYTEYLIDGYKINADRYFIKPISQEVFDIEMEAVIHRYFRNCESFFDESISDRKIYYREILYVDYFERRTRIHLTDGTVLITNDSLKYWIEKLGNTSFGQSHKAYVVHFDSISEFTPQDIILTTGQRIPLSRKYKKDFKQKYYDYLHHTL